MIHLELPNIKYKETYLSAVKEFLEKGSDNESTNHYLKKSLEEWDKTFEEFVKLLIDNHNGMNLSEGWVPCTEFWIIDENDKYVGRISLRHTLNEYLSKHGGHIGYDIIPSERGKSYSQKALELCLKEAKKLGLKTVLVTADNDNIASIKSIERNDGVLRDKIEHNGVLTRRYDIKL